MGFQNSRVKKTVLGLYRETLLDLYDTLLTHADQLPAFRLKREFEQDMRYVEGRFAAEGLSFGTTCLPLLGKWVDSKLSGKSLEYPLGIKREFLRSACELLSIATKPGEESTELANFIKKLRTFLYLTYKLELPPSPEQIKRKLEEFKETENEVSCFVLPADNRYVEWARHVMEFVVGDFNPLDNLLPKHGPGSVATGEKGDGKWVFSHLYDSLHQVYPYYDYMYGIRSNGRALHLASCIERYKNMKRLPFPTAKLCLVPKDSRGPRVISSEPLELQFMQQAVLHRLAPWIECNTQFLCDETRKPVSRINFRDQSVNANHALSSSRTGKFATLDLSEASDRVSLTLFRALWPLRHQRAFEALRSHATISPDGEIISLSKFAPMGSAICFPVESTIFFSLCVAALLEEGVPFNLACQSVYVYGDDIVVPSEHFDCVCKVLELHGLKVNVSKSFASGYFRESCGCDAWLGQDVTPHRIRKLPGEDPGSGTAHVAWLAYASQFTSSGMTRSARYCKEIVELALGTKIPVTAQDNGYLSVIDPSTVTPLNEYSRVQWSTELSMPTAIVWTSKTKSTATQLDGYERLLRDILVSGPEVDPNRVVVDNATLISKKRRGLRSFDVFDWLSMG